EDLWSRPGGGGGRTRVIQGEVIEKGGVNFSAVAGALPEKIAQSLKLEPGSDFFATGVSIVMHPFNPHVPIIHMNVRYFEITDPESKEVKTWWFGGGIDLTPHYVDEGDAQFFHDQLKTACDQSHPDFYPKFKKWADDYFFIKHRKETRGIGGIFFDHLDETTGLSKADLFQFVKNVGESFAPTYTWLVKKNKDLPFSENEKNWQLHRRGRYVEFNLVWDRGTKFGLETNGRTESILMSLPPMAMWTYDFQIAENSREAETQSFLIKGIDW
ncbi:MAG: coproporphyrinogen III oxidase, partial [Saprospiraceae bacterium]